MPTVRSKWGAVHLSTLSNSWNCVLPPPGRPKFSLASPDLIRVPAGGVVEVTFTPVRFRIGTVQAKFR